MRPVPSTLPHAPTSTTLIPPRPSPHPTPPPSPTHLGLFEITDRGSSWFGPLVAALLKHVTGDIRWSFVYIFLALVGPIYWVDRINVDRGRLRALRMASPDDLAPTEVRSKRKLLQSIDMAELETPSTTASEGEEEEDKEVGGLEEGGRVHCG